MRSGNPFSMDWWAMCLVLGPNSRDCSGSRKSYNFVKPLHNQLHMCLMIHSSLCGNDSPSTCSCKPLYLLTMPTHLATRRSPFQAILRGARGYSVVVGYVEMIEESWRSVNSRGVIKRCVRCRSLEGLQSIHPGGAAEVSELRCHP